MASSTPTAGFAAGCHHHHHHHRHNHLHHHHYHHHDHYGELPSARWCRVKRLVSERLPGASLRKVGEDLLWQVTILHLHLSKHKIQFARE